MPQHPSVMDAFFRGEASGQAARASAQQRESHRQNTLANLQAMEINRRRMAAEDASAIEAQGLARLQGELRRDREAGMFNDPATGQQPTKLNMMRFIEEKFARGGMTDEAYISAMDKLKGKLPEDFTLGEGQIRFDATGRQIAAGGTKAETGKYGSKTIPISNTQQQEFEVGLDGRVDMSKPIGKPRPIFSPQVDGGGANNKFIVDNQGNTNVYDNQGNFIRNLGKVSKPTATFEKAKLAKGKMMMDFERVIPELEKLTKDGGLIDQATGSGIGAGLDWVAKGFGYGTEGAIAIGQLQPIYDLVLKLVPRFEGPQSDKDVATYREAAGQIANPNVPNEIKKAAAKEILRLFKARRNQFSTTDYENTPQAEQDESWSDL